MKNLILHLYREKLVLFTALLCVLFVMPAHAEPIITKMSGQAEIRTSAAASWTKAKAKSALPAGASVRVQGKGSVRIEDTNAHTTLILNSGTEVGYEGAEQDAASGKPLPVYSIPRGKVDVSIVPGNNLDLLAPLILTSVRGTKFAVQVKNDGSSSVQVKKGTVLVTDKIGQIKKLTAGQSHSLSAQEYINFILNTPKPDFMPRSGGGGGGARGGGGGSSGGGGGDDGGGDD